MDLDLVTLSRIQFALTIMFHYLFPPLSIGLGLVMVVLEGLHMWTKQVVYATAARFWTRLFAVNFAVGVATGIVMEFQFGTNWAPYSRFVGDVFGSALAAEGIFAFFLESGFLAVLVFGWDRVSPRMHMFATTMVFLGSCFSAVWIVIANAWQQTPTGFELVAHEAGVRAEIVDFWAMVFNPSAMHRLGHVLLGSFILGGFFVCSISAWYVLKGRHGELAKRCFVAGLSVAALASWAELVSGHAQARMVAEYQPAKLAAFEGHFHSEPHGTGLWLFGWPDEAQERVRFGLEIPHGLSFLVHDDFDRPVTALDAFPPRDRPPVVIPFVSYHLMVACGMYFIALTTFAAWCGWRGTLWRRRWLLWTFVLSVPLPYLANQVGWVAAEVGRQPWVVYGLLRTEDAVSIGVPPTHVLGSIVLFSCAYLALFAIWALVMHEKIQHGPKPPEGEPQFGDEGLVHAAAEVRIRRGGRSLMEDDDPAPRASDVAARRKDE